jgi:hypothetical protein
MPPQMKMNIIATMNWRTTPRMSSRPSILSNCAPIMNASQKLYKAPLDAFKSLVNKSITCRKPTKARNALVITRVNRRFLLNIARRSCPMKRTITKRTLSRDSATTSSLAAAAALASAAACASRVGLASGDFPSAQSEFPSAPAGELDGVVVVLLDGLLEEPAVFEKV